MPLILLAFSNCVIDVIDVIAAFGVWTAVVGVGAA
jgi:hypothetical protein